MAVKNVDLRQQLLGAALECSDADTTKTFSSEELLVAAWKRDKASWGLRGYERDYPDSNRIHRELDSRGKGHEGIVGAGLLERVRPRIYRLTPKGLAAAASASTADPRARERTDRVFEGEITRILEHPTFIGWLKDQGSPTRFRDVGHFWGVAPGTPPKVVRQRVRSTEDTLRAALSLLEQRGVRELGDRQGRLLFDADDVKRGLDFQQAMKNRFQRDLAALTGGEPL